MTTLNPHAPSLRRPSGSSDSSSRVRLALTAALAVAALGVGGTATGVLATGSLTGSAPADPADPAASAAPAAPAVSPAPVDAAPPTAAAAPTAPAGTLAAVDTRGRPLPPATERGARSVFDALARGDVAALRPAYAPVASGASWSAVSQLLADPRDRAGLLAAMSSPPQARAEVPYLYARDGYRVGLDDAGRIRFVRAP